MDIKDRLRLLIDNKGNTPYKVWKDTGVSQQLLSKYLSGKVIPSSNNLRKLAQYFEVSTDWLLTGLDNTCPDREAGKSNIVSESTPEYKPIKQVKTIDSNGIQIPFIPIHAIALFIESFYNLSSHYQYNTYHITPRPGESLNPSEYIVFEIEGNSMSPTIKPNSLILTKLIPEKQWEYAEGVVVVIYGKSLILKRIKKNDLFGNNQILLSSDNPNHGDIEIERSQIQAIYKAKRIISEDII